MSETEPIFILGGYQTDFARNWTKEGKHISAMFNEVVTGALQATQIPPEDVEVGHVGNFAVELYTMQGHLGAFLVETHPSFSGLPTGRHEAACASGSTEPQFRSKASTSRRTSMRRVVASTLLSSMPMMLPRKVWQVVSGEKLAR